MVCASASLISSLFTFDEARGNRVFNGPNLNLRCHHAKTNRQEVDDTLFTSNKVKVSEIFFAMVSKREAISAQADATLLKEIIKLIHRIERILVPPNSLVHSTIGERLDGLIARIKKGEFFQDVNKFPLDDLIGYDAKSIEPLFRQVAWEKLHSAIWLSVSDGNESYELPSTVLNEIGMEQQVHDDKLQKAANKERVRRMQVRFNL